MKATVTRDTDRGCYRPHLQSGHARSRGPTYPIVLDTRPSGGVIETINDPTVKTEIKAGPASYTSTLRLKRPRKGCSLRCGIPNSRR